MSTKWNRMTARIMAALLALLLVAEGALPSFAGELSPEGAGSDTYESEGSVLSEETESFEEGTDTDPERTDEQEDLPGSPENEDPDEDINDPDINITGDDPTEDAGLIREEEADPGKEFGIYEDDGDDFIHAENEIIEETMTEITEDHAESLKDGEVASGNCGLKDEANNFHEEDVVWSVTDLGEAGYQLTIELAEGVDTSVKYTTCENSSYGSPWSYYNQKIKKLVIGDGIKKIGKYSFYSMQNLTEVTFGTDVTEFGNNLFQDCKSLQTITLPAGLTTVGSCIFEGCTGLTSITIPESLTGISNGMFSGCSKLATVNMHDGITSIGETAFISCSALTSVTLPSGLETIGKQAFQSSGLTSVTIPAGVTTLPEKAFHYCGSLASVAFGVDEEENYGIETIGDYAFSNCSLLSSITLPSSVTTLRSYAFAYNGKLTEVNLNEGLLTIGEGAFKSFKAASLTIPSTVTTLNNYAFSSNSLLTEIIFAKNAEEKCALTKIGQYAFADATKLTEITLPASVTNIEYPNILNGCSLLAHIYVEDGNTVYRNRKDAQNVKDGVVYKIDGDTESLYIRPPAFTGCIMPSEGTVTLTKDYFSGTDVTEVVLPASIKTIDSNAFDGCTKLASITFAEGTVLETIGSYAFRGCTALEAIDLPPSLKTINSSAFEGCSRLAAVTFETDEEEHLSLTTLGSYAFYKCSSLGSITLPGTITRMDGNIFQSCTSLASVNFGEGWSLTIINGNTFNGCTSLTGITIPDSVTEIKDNAFCGCTGITSLNIPGTVTKINSSAFKGCSGITTLTLNDGLTEIGYYAFEDCTGITSLTVPKTVTKILGAAFKGNTSLATLTFAKDDDGTCALTDITGGQSFGGTALTTVTIPISIVNLTDSTFQNCAELRAVNIEEGDPANPKYYSIAGIVYLVSNNTPFIKPAKADLSQMVIQEDPEGILRKDYYKGNTSITEVTIPAWVTKIEAEAFKGCTALKKVKYADGCKLAAIGANAFENCTSLTSFTCPSTIKETGIGSYAFKGCTSLGSVTLSKNMTKIASYLFQNCSSLTSVKIPAGVTQIMSYAFSGCTSLALVTFEGTSALTEIQWDAFENTALKSITLPKSLTSLDRSAFYNSASLENINIESGNTVYYSESGIVYKKADGSVYITPPKNQHKDDTKTEFTSADVPANATTVTIPKNIRVIKSGAFKNNSKVKTVKFAKGSKLTTIEEQAFCRASSLTTIKLPSGLKTIGYRAFYDCDAIKSIKIPATVTSIGTEAFSSCAKLSSATIPAKVTELGDMVFDYNPELKSATINCPNTGKKTFYSCGKLATVKLGSGVKTIGDSCFYNDSSLKKLTLNKGLTSIGETAFYCCTSLKSVSIPATVTSAGIGTFNSCTNLASATIPGSLTSIPNSMFYGCRSLKKATIQKGVTTIGPSAFSTTLLPSVSLPDTVNFIGNNAFKDCMVLKSIRIPDKVTFIGTSVFEGCASLEKFSWPASITSIPSGTFRYCSRLSEIVLPEGTASISDYAFEGCTSLKILNVPSTVSSIDVLAFKLDSALEEINVADGNATYLSVDGILYRRTAAGKEFVYCPLAWNSSDTLTPPDGLDSIPAKAYYGNKTIVNLVIPATVTSIGESAFENCTSLRTVTFEAGCRLTSLPASAFSGCIDLNSVSFLGDTSVTSFGNYAFYQCADLTEIRFEDNSTDIAVGKECFYQDYAFTGIFEGKELASLGDIGYGAFYQCRSIRDLRIGASCETIGTTRSEDADADVFAGCENLRSFTADDGGIFSAVDGVLFREDWDDGEFSVTGPTLFKYPFQKTDEEYTIPEGTVAVANYAFANCKEIVSVTPSEELEIIYKRGFYQSSVEEFDFETAGSSLRVIDVAAFRGCSSLKKADLGESSIRVLQGSAFRNCSRMQEVILPEDQMTAIGSYAFYGCSAMKHMNLDDTVTTIGDYAFNSCGSWLDVRIPQGLTGSIPKYAYAYCYKLKTLEFPAGVTSLGDYAFYYCSGLETVTIPATLKSIGERCFYDCYGMTELNFADRSEGENLYIDDWAFRYCSKLTQVKLPEKLTSIGSEVFGDCSELKRVDLPSTLASVANNTYITINNSKIYGSYMFLNDSKLRQLIVRNPALNLMDNAFYSTNSSSGTQTVYVYSRKYADPEAADPVETVIYRYCENKSSSKYALTFVELEDLDDENADPGYENPDPVNPDDPSSYPKSGVVKAADNAEIAWSYDEDTKTVTISGTCAMPNRTTGWVNVDGVLTNMEAQTIPWKYYYGKVAEHLVIGDGITGIGNYAFNNMTALKDVSLPTTLASIGDYAFYCCSSLTSLVMPTGLRSIGSDAFCGCSLLTSITMNEGLETVAYDAFYQTRITELHLPSTLTAINPDALNYCFLTESEGGNYISALETVTVAEGNRYYRVEDNVLYRTENGKETQIWGRLVRKMEIDGEETDVLYIPASYQTAYEDSNLDRSYRYAKVTCIIVDEDNPVYSTDEDHTALYSKDGSILYMVPYDHEGELTVREGTRIIGKNAMRSRSYITKVSFPDSVTEIRDGAMYYCTSLREAEFGSSLWKIGYEAFYNCSSLRKVTLPEGIEEIGNSAFSSCYALRSVNLPATLTSLGTYAFAYCDELRSIEIPGSIGTISEDCFYSDDRLDDVRIGEGITEIGEWAFGYCTSLERITLPESLRSIRNNAFSYSSSLARVEIPASVDDIYYSTSTSGSTNYYYSPFEYCAYELTFYGERGCYAQSWVENNDIKYETSPGYYRIHNASFVTGVPAKYLITYVLDPDEGEQNHIANPASFRAEGEVITLYPATKEASTEAPDGYEFGGWYTDKELTEPVEKIIPSADRHSFTLYPEWLRNNRVSIETEEGDVIVLVPNGRSLSDVGYQPVSEDGKRSAGLVFADNEDLAFSLNAPVYEDLQLKAVFVSADEAHTKAPFSSVESGEVPVGIAISLLSDTPDAHIYYTLNGNEPLDAEGEAAEDALRYKDRILLTEEVFDGEDTVTLKAMAVKKGAVSAMSVYEYRLMDEDGYWGSVLPMDRSEYAEAEKTAGGLWIAGLRESYPYTGAAVKPGIRVYDGKALLKEGKDYTVSFKNNVNATPENAPESKLPQLTVTGKNNYKDSMKATFRIGQKDVSSFSYTAKCYLTWTETIDGSYYYFEEPVFVKLNPGKKAQKPVPALNDNGKALKAGKDFTVRYYAAVFKKENDRLPETADDITTNWGRYTPMDAPKDPGIYCVAVTGKGNYTGTRYFRFHIEKDLIPISKAQITGFVKSYEYDDGDAIYQNKMVLKRGKDTLVSGTDYSLSYSNNREVGTATLIIYGRGKYTGMVKKTYKIIGLPFKKAKLYEFQKSLSYTGKPLFQTDAFFTYPVKTDTGITYVDLIEGADYKVSYSRNIEKGKATVTYTGLGLLYGSVKKTFTIKGLDINKASKQKRPTVKAVIEGGNNVPYAKGGVKPAVSVTFREQPLAEGRDYTVKYRNNLKLAEASGKNTDPAVIITGKGNFAGSITIPFSIVESDIGSLSINASDVVYGTRENAAAAKVKITDTTGKALIAGTDYEKAFEYAFEEPGSVVNAQGTPAGNKAAGDAFDPSTEYPAAGSVIRVTVTGKGNYRETISAVYRVTTADISKAVIKLKAGKTFTYTGSGIVPSKEDLSVKVGGKELTDTDYEIISVTNNLSKGKAILTIRGTGPNYGGIKTQTFAINAKSMK